MKQIAIVEKDPTSKWIMNDFLVKIFKGNIRSLIFFEDMLSLIKYENVEKFDLVISNIHDDSQFNIDNLLYLNSKNGVSKKVILTEFRKNHFPSIIAENESFHFIEKRNLDELIKVVDFKKSNNTSFWSTELTSEENKIMRLICQDLTEGDICDALCISESGFYKKKNLLAKKLGIKNRPISFLRFALKNGLYDIKKEAV